MAEEPGDGLKPGSILGHYVLEEQVGGGAMGRVWLGSDRRDQSRVAVKVLNPQFSRDPTFRQRFEREAHLATLLKSPYTVQTFAFGREAGAYYLVMEFVQGDSVEKMLSKGPLPLDEALEIATDAARALEASAAHKIVHRDLKPSNIIVSPDGAAKLVDFGIAGQANIQDSAGAFIGTVQYAPPEQQRGQVDERTDIYALGATLFHMLAGRPPYLGRTNEDILQQHLHAPFPAPLLALHPEPVVDVVRRCMQKDPEDRYHSAADLAAALDRVRMRIVQVRTSTAPILADELRTLVPEPEPMSEPTGDTLILPAAPTPSRTPRPLTSGETIIHAPSTPPPATPDSLTTHRPRQAPVVAAPAPPPAPAYREQETMVAAPVAVPVAAGAGAPPEKRRGKGMLFAIFGGGAAVIAAGAVGAVLALSGGGGDPEPATPESSASAAASASASATRSPTSRPSASASPEESPTSDGGTATETATEEATATATDAPPTATPTTAGPTRTNTPVPPTATPTTPPRATFSVSVTGGCSGLSASVTASGVSGSVNIVGTWSGGSTPILPPSASAVISAPGGTATFNTGGVGSGTYSFSATADGVPIGSGSATC